MSGDLEDFLRRAAQRRQAKSAQQQQPPARQRPQYSDRSRERVVDAIVVEEPIMTEVIDDNHDSLTERRKRLERSRQAAAEAEAQAAQALKKVQGGGSRTGSTNVSLSGVPARDLVRLLRLPGGISQAILLREILDRPEHRW